MKIDLREGKFDAEFNVNCLFSVLRKQGYNKLSDLEKMFNIGDDPTIDDIDNMCQLVVEGIAEGSRIKGEESEVSLESIRPWLLEDQTRLEKVVTEVMNSMPSQEESDAQGGGKKKGQKATQRQRKSKQ